MIRGDARFSDDGLSRFMVARHWDDALPLAAWLLQNPSRAGAEEGDPTTTRAVHFSRRVGAGGCVLLNPLPWIATDPDDLWRALDAGEIPAEHMAENLDEIERQVARAAILFVGFGSAVPRWAPVSLRRALDRFLPRGRGALCLGTSPSGWPLHPLARGKLAIRNDVTPIPWTRPV
jgi:hypothetical protein